MKKLIFSTALAAIFTMSPAAADPFKGVSAGAQLGYTNVKGTGSVTGSSGTAQYGANVAYSTIMNGKWYTGAELGLEHSAVNGVKQLTPYMDAKLGYKLSERAVGYGLAGGMYNFAKAGGVSNSKLGYRLGAGVAFAVNENVVLGAQYTYSKTNALNFGGLTKANLTNHNIAARAGYKF